MARIAVVSLIGGVEGRVAGSGRVGLADQGQPPRVLAAASVLASMAAMVRRGT